ncbi:MAG: hypothetical protein CVT92_08665 [Bacteroidetes bacterium HGW-Bacteroidetes-1]|jgi:4-amino-4-deoxy-L-arabinose transferase-like glycosyltransferase|nr:MAG: hypothetical protein CVT92_08665 [Bacteroidetes bacterium HGW-Bacteroidetes-1]
MKISACSKAMKKKMILLLSFSVIVRLFFASWLELGNDEVYYWTYALYPDWSHFDHPPMVGWMIQLFSLNLYFDSELFIRLSSVILTTANTILVFLIGKKIRNESTGYYAALLYTASIYAFVITGIMILPDTPQNFFWMLALWLMMLALDETIGKGKLNLFLLLIGLTIGLGMISKYTSVFEWVGWGLFILIYKREWLKKPALYVSVIISALCTLPVILWNIDNDFISFSFQSERVNIFSASLRPDLFASELLGQFLYNNPINVTLIAVMLLAVFRGKQWLLSDYQRLLLLISLPMIGLFLAFSLFRATLPHWTGPAYNTLLILAAARLAVKRPMRDGIIQLPDSIKLSFALLIFVLTMAGLQIKFGIIPFPDNNPYHRLGRNDITLDMYGWRKLMPAFKKVREKHLTNGLMQSGDAFLGENWFPLANIDYYLAKPLEMRVMGLGQPQRLHKYLWINEKRGGFSKGDNFWYLTTSRDYKHPDEVYNDMFDSIVPSDTITINRNGKPAKRVFIFLLKDLQKLPEPFFKK